MSGSFIYVNTINHICLLCINSFVDKCSLSPDSGPCVNNTYRWYYNSAVGRCQQFTYGGCGGNKNNFKKLETCLQQCGKYFK